MSLMIYNTYSQKKEKFVPITENKVSIYVCGPTVYNYVHIGNLRPPIFFSVVVKWLEATGYRVNYVSNYTDIDDRIIAASQKEGISTEEITSKYIKAYEEDFTQLKIRSPDLRPKVTDFITQIINLIQKLIDNKYAYVGATGDVLYSVKSFKEYGNLSHKNIEELQVGARVEIDSLKENPLDFTLWKKAKPGEPKWSSPWGEGRPGWHIECSAMILTLLGESIDIHGGGIDLIFPHHENEIAQNRGASNNPFVKYWMHNNHIHLGAQKMSKSLGNILTGHDFLKSYPSELLKFMFLSAHYRSQMDFSETQIQHSISGLARIYSALKLASENQNPISNDFSYFLKALNAAEEKFTQALNDDFNTPEALASIFDLVRAFNQQIGIKKEINPELSQTFTDWIKNKGALLSLFNEPASHFLMTLDNILLSKKNLSRSQIDELVKQRTLARTNRDFKRADEIRNELLTMGIEIRDSKDGSSWEVQK